MVNRLKPLNVMDFTGGVNLRPETFQLLENELPFMLNMEVDPRGGINTRMSWRYANPNPATPGAWNPRNAFLHVTAAGDKYLMLANSPASGQVEVRAQVNNAAFTEVQGANPGASPHGADFASWGDLVYVSRGSTASFAWNGSTVIPLAASGAANWQNDYTAPGSTDTCPRADIISQHSGYLFTASTYEDAGTYPNRIRWSHPNNPRRWAAGDYIDISEGGQRITAIVPFSDRLLIFKPDSVWALYGYNAETWEVANISRTIGAHSQQVVARSEDAVFFLSWPEGVFAYTEKANIQELSVQIRHVFGGYRMDPVAMDNAYMGWVGRRLWVSLPYLEDAPSPDDARTAFVWDPVLGSWTMFRGADMCVPGPYIERVEADEVRNQLTFIRQYPYPVTLDNDLFTAVDECRPTHEHMFDTVIRTRWLDAGNPTWKKSWRRPDFLLRALAFDSVVNVQVFHDFDNYNAERSFLVQYTPDNYPSVWGHFIYGDGTLYGGSDQTQSVERGGTMGRAGVVQLQAVGNPGVRWGLNGIIFKFIPRRFR